ncbi:unnamed protein product [Enterobius vermicularis]|uniref:C-type lectin domain-containing protein n=1 Tax=Enterobius vermicularis TaxID=51028 RepID=A0A0N4VBW9_ENTVE|nr:unnamed protein product [Enterobius vermicularis]
MSLEEVFFGLRCTSDNKAYFMDQSSTNFIFNEVQKPLICNERSCFFVKRAENTPFGYSYVAQGDCTGKTFKGAVCKKDFTNKPVTSRIHAEQYCRERNGYIAAFSSEAEEAFIKKSLKKGKGMIRFPLGIFREHGRLMLFGQQNANYLNSKLEESGYVIREGYCYQKKLLFVDGFLMLDTFDYHPCLGERLPLTDVVCKSEDVVQAIEVNW